MPLDFEIEEFEGLDPAPPIDDKTTIDDGFDLSIDDKPTDDVIVNDGEPPVNTQSDDVEDPIYLSVLEKSGLEFTDEELATLKDDEEGIVTAAQLIADKRAKSQYDTFLSKNDRIKQFNDFVLNNEGDPDTFFKSVERIANIKDLTITETAIDVQRNVARTFYKEKGFSDAMIEKQISMLENSDMLFESSKEFKAEIVKFEEAKHNELLAQQAQLSEAQKEEQEIYTKQFKEIADKGVINNIPLSKTEKTELFDYMFTPDTTGKTKYQEDSAKLNAEQIMMIGLLVKRGLKLDTVIKQAADTQTSKSLRDRLRATNKQTNIAGKRQADVSKLELEDFEF